MNKVYDPFCTFCGRSDTHSDTCKFYDEPEESYFTVVFVEGDFAAPVVGDDGNDFSAYKVVSLAEGDCRQEAMLLQAQLRTVEAENAKARELMRAVVDINERLAFADDYVKLANMLFEAIDAIADYLATLEQ